MAQGIKDKVAIIGMGCTSFGERWNEIRGQINLYDETVGYFTNRVLLLEEAKKAGAKGMVFSHRGRPEEGVVDETDDITWSLIFKRVRSLTSVGSGLL